MSDATTGTKLEQTGEMFLVQSMLFEYMGICVLSPAHESEMRGYRVYVLIVKYLSILFKFSHSILDWTALSWILGGIFKAFLEGSVDHIIYRDYIANRRSFIYCSLACCLLVRCLAVVSVVLLFDWAYVAALLLNLLNVCRVPRCCFSCVMFDWAYVAALLLNLWLVSTVPCCCFSGVTV